ncbi:MAG: ABC transporter ATP-binding protein [Deltaproteobacteria bacterium]|nr:ABC transporter ATP-binding protein [Deltaproteobacteria bacterium]
MILEIKDLHTYYGASHILQSVDLVLDQGELVCLLGRNGVGKSTTLKSIIGLVPPRKGSVLFNGIQLAGLDPYRIARLGVGFVPEERRIFKGLTVLENLQIGIKKAHSQTDREPWNAETIFEMFTKLGERSLQKGGHLSGGEQQMLTVARTLMGNPELILVDEPTEGLAPLVADSVLKMLGTISDSGVTILMVEQNYKAALKLARGFYIMSKGQMVFHGTGEELVAAEKIRQKYLEV